MSQINTEGWREYTIEDIFPKIIKPTVYHVKHIEEDPTGIPYVVRSKFNNGTKFNVKRPKGDINPANVISFGAENATFFYQPREWVSGRDMYYIDTRNYSKHTCLFLTACLQPIAQKYSYNFGLFPELLKKEKIKLPVNNEGNPDFSYMETYMQILEGDVRKSLMGLKTIQSDTYSPQVNTATWKQFCLKDIFEWNSQIEINPALTYNSIDAETLYPFYGQSSVNNGIIAYVNIGEKYLNNVDSKTLLLIHSNNHIISVTNSPFYLKDGHGATSVIGSEHLNEYNALFIMSVLRNSFDSVFDYKMKATKVLLKNHKIKLPVDTEGKPDWGYMESYIKSIEVKMGKSLKDLQAALG